MENLFEIKLNINQISELVGMHRQTVSQRIAGLTPTMGSNSKLKLYLLADLLRLGMYEKMTADVDSMSPMDRKAYWQAENERLRYEEKTGELVPAFEVAQQMAILAKTIVQQLETLPDILERDVGLQPKALIRVQQVIDDLRDQMAVHIKECSQPDNQQEDE